MTTHLITQLRLLGCLDARQPSAGDISAAVTRFEVAVGLPSTGALDDAALSRLTRILEHRGHVAGPADVAFSEGAEAAPQSVIAGVAHRTAGSAGLGVEILRASLRTGSEQEVLARGTTSEHGEFVLRLSMASPTAVRLRIKAGETTLHVSPPRLLISELWIEWSESGEPTPRPGSFDLRDALLQAELVAAGRSLHDLDGASEDDELALLAEAAGVPHPSARAHAVAARLARRLDIPAAAAYVLLDGPRGGLSVAPAEDLARASAPDLGRLAEDARADALGRAGSVLIAAIERAVNAGEISSAIRAELPEIQRRLAAARAAFVLEQPVGEGSCLRELLLSAGAGDGELQLVASAITDHPDEQAWRQIGGSIGEGRASTIRDGLRMAAFVAHDAPALDGLRRGGVRSPRALAKLSETELHDRLAGTIPDGVARDLLVARIAERADVEFPAETLLRRRGARISSAARALLDAGEGSFDLHGGHVDRLIHDAGLPAEEAEAVRSELLRMQRVTRVSRHGGVANALLDRGYTSAQQIAFTDPAMFRAEMREVLPVEAADRLQARAVAHYRATLAIYLQHNRGAVGPPLAVLSPLGDPAQAAIPTLPTYAALFGPQDSCPCPDCSSVTSPSAYLVDLLLWLQRAPAAPGALKPYDALIARRPDLIRVLLNCDNSEIEVPYIDLVCELLEDEVALRAHRITPDDRLKLLDQRQTHLEASEIRAYPEYVNQAVYTLLAGATDAMSLPFDLALAEARACISVAGSSRLDLLRAFARPNSPTDADLAAERFGLDSTELRLVTTPDPSHQAQVWGFSPDQPISVADLLHRSPHPKLARAHISYDDLLRLLDTSFVNPARTITIALKPGVVVDACHVTDRSMSGWNARSLDRLHRFLRLARHVPWSIAELDLLVSAAGVASGAAAGGDEPAWKLDGQCLARLSTMADHCASLRLEPEEIAYFFRPFLVDASSLQRFDGRASLYAQRFLARTGVDAIPAAYASLAAPGATATPRLVDEQPRLAAALGVTSDEIGLLLAMTDLVSARVDAGTLAILYRHARLAEALEASVSDLSILRRVLGDPFVDGARLRDFTAGVSLLRSSGLSAKDLDALVPASGATPTLDTASVTQDLRAFQSTQIAILRDRLERDPTPAELHEQIGTSWIPLLTRWLGLDLRLGAILAAVAADAPAGGLSLFDDTTRPAALATAARAARLAGLLRITVAEGTAVAHLPGVRDVVTNPAWAPLQRALGLIALGRKATSFEAFADYIAALDDAARTREQLRDALATALQFKPSVIDAAWDDLFGAGLLDRPALGAPDHYATLEARATVGEKIVASPAQLAAWARAWPDHAQAVGLSAALRATTSREAWLATSTAIQDPIRGRKRDALIDYLLATRTGDQPRTAGDLYGEMLIDVEMEDCRVTSRVVQASGAIQLFVQRCFLGMEGVFAGSAASSDAHWQQWEWRKRYRLWEANRKIFLYPESFLDPARRATASPLFGELLKNVRQHEVNDENVSKAFEAYLAGLEEIANLDYAALASDSTQLGVVGRTRGTAPRHFYRSLSGGVWSPWEDLSIGGASSHLELAQIQGKSWLVWPNLMDYANPTQDFPSITAVQGDSAGKVLKAPKAISYLRFGWTMRDAKGRWSPVRTTSRAFLFSRRPARSLLVKAFTKPTDPPGAFRVEAYVAGDDGAQTSGLNVRTLGVMSIARDTTSTWAVSNTMGLQLPIGGEHQYELQRIQIQNFDATPANLYTFTPWQGLVFDENRQVSPAAATTAALAKIEVLDPTTAGNPRITLMAPPVMFAITADPVWFKSEPKSDAFAVTTSQWSMLCLSAVLRDGLVGKPAQPTAPFFASPLYHPFASELRETVRAYGFERLFVASVQENPASLGRPAAKYADLCGVGAAVTLGSVAEAIDFEAPAAYALYNWELFVHAPLAISDQLMANRRFEDAKRYLEFIFNPFTSEPPDPARPRARFWITKPFRHPARPEEESDIGAILASGVADPTIFRVIEQHPFDADAVAQVRPIAYQKHVVMRYLDNLIAWGDSLFRAGEPEDINESTQIYLLAQSILGDRPEPARPLGVRRDLAFKDADWGGEGNVLAHLESVILDAGPGVSASEASPPLVHLPLVAVGDAATGASSLYFRVTPSAKLLGYWDTVASRLDNIRHCRTIDGTLVKIPLLGSPIDPQALADAAAAGVSVADAIAMVSAQPPPYRFRVMLAKAQEYCGEVKALGASLLSALEKRDAESIARVRSTHEGRVLAAARTIKNWQRQQAESDRDALTLQKATIQARRDYYASRTYMIDLELAAFDLSFLAAELDTAGFVFDVLSGSLYLIPNVNLGVSGFGGTPQAGASLGGESAGSSTHQASQGLSKLAGILDRAASLTSTQAGYVRRQDDWQQQAKQASLELAQLETQIAAAKLRVSVIDAELGSQGLQEKSWNEIDGILQEKFSRTELYDWTVERVGELYRVSYEQARTMAGYAEACFRFETGEAPTPIPASHWESLKHGLLAGEGLARDLRDLETAYLSRASYDHLVVQHVPLSQVDPAALISLWKGGSASFEIPAWWFQRVYPGLKQRRIKSVAVSVPCITGAYVSVNASLRLNGQKHVGRTAIYLSTGVSDHGCDMSVAGEQYLPFEGASLDETTSWTFGFPSNEGKVLPSTDVDLSRIADVVLHIEYTANEGAAAAGDVGPDKALALLDLRRMASDAWFALVAASGDHTTTLRVGDVLPSFLQRYSLVGVRGSMVALDRAGKDQSASFDAPTTVGDQLTIRAKTGSVVAWDQLDRLMLLLELSKS